MSSYKDDDHLSLQRTMKPKVSAKESFVYYRGTMLNDTLFYYIEHKGLDLFILSTI